MEQSTSNGLIQRSKLQDLTEIKRCILENKGWPGLLFTLFPINSFFDGFIHFDDIFMTEFFKDRGFFIKNIAENLWGICIIPGGELNGKVLPIIGGQLDFPESPLA